MVRTRKMTNGYAFQMDGTDRSTDAHGALIFIMVLASTSDGGMSDTEIDRLSEIVKFLPVFATFDIDRMPSLTQECIGLLQDPDGIDLALDVIDTALPAELRETGYALACEVIASDGFASQEELRLLELLRHKLDLSRLHSAAIELGVRARNRTL